MTTKPKSSFFRREDAKSAPDAAKKRSSAIKPKVAKPRGEKPVITKPVGERKPAPAKKSVATAPKVVKDDSTVRLNRFVAQSGVCSRREADELIAAGRIAVNGVAVTALGTKVDPAKDTITYDGKPLSGERLVYILMNKPKDYVTTVEDPHAERTVIDLLRGKVRERIYPIGRLDKNTTGVLLLTNDGDLTRELTHPSFEKRKIYHVFLDKPVEEEHLSQMLAGVELEDGKMVVDEAAYVEKNRKEVGIEIHSGRNRIVRRLFEHFGYKVNKLDRVYFAGFTKEGLRRSFWRELTAPEILKLKSGKYR